MSDNLKAAKECGFKTIKWDGTTQLHCNAEQLEAYTSRRLASQQAAHDAEIAERDNLCNSLGSRNEQLHKELSAANAACAMKDEALKDIARGQLQVPDFEKYAVRVATDALSASPQQVSELERRQLEPLMRRIAELEAQINK